MFVLLSITTCFHYDVCSPRNSMFPGLCWQSLSNMLSIRSHADTSHSCSAYHKQNQLIINIRRSQSCKHPDSLALLIPDRSHSYARNGTKTLSNIIAAKNPSTSRYVTLSLELYLSGFILVLPSPPL